MPAPKVHALQKLYIVAKLDMLLIMSCQPVIIDHMNTVLNKRAALLLLSVCQWQLVGPGLGKRIACGRGEVISIHRAPVAKQYARAGYR